MERMADDSELDTLAVAAISATKPEPVMPPRGDDEHAWARWLLDVDFAIGALNRQLQPRARVIVSLERTQRRLRIKPMVELRGVEADDIAVVESAATAGAVEELLGHIGAPFDRLRRAANALVRQFDDGRMSEKLDNIHYADWDALELSEAS
jgi:hypothetical protein